MLRNHPDVALEDFLIHFLILCFESLKDNLFNLIRLILRYYHILIHLPMILQVPLVSFPLIRGLIQTMLKLMKRLHFMLRFQVRVIYIILILTQLIFLRIWRSFLQLLLSREMNLEMKLQGSLILNIF